MWLPQLTCGGYEFVMVLRLLGRLPSKDPYSRDYGKGFAEYDDPEELRTDWMCISVLFSEPRARHLHKLLMSTSNFSSNLY